MSGQPVPSSAKIPVYIVDAFTEEPFTGNPAAVCLLPEGHATIITFCKKKRGCANFKIPNHLPLPATVSGTTFYAAKIGGSGKNMAVLVWFADIGWFGSHFSNVCILRHIQTTPARDHDLKMDMFGKPERKPDDVVLTSDLMQTIASELNLSETTFISSCDFEKDTKFPIRWFTPTNEVPLCGHATLATSAVLFNAIGNTNDVIEFSSLSGKLFARKRDNLIALDFPLNVPVDQEESEVSNLIKTVLPTDWVQDIQYSATTKKLLLRLKDSLSRQDLEDLQPDVNEMMKSEPSGKTRGVIVTMKASDNSIDKKGERYDFLSRYFAPWNGIPEDPVTGSAHTVLAGYWRRIMNKNTFYARQCSKRGGELHISIEEDRVMLMGAARIVLDGTLTL